MSHLRGSGIPLVVIDNFHRDSALGWYVDSGAYDAGFLATDYLLDRGLETVGLVAPDDYFGWKLMDGYWDAHRRRWRSTSPYHVKMLGLRLDVEQATRNLLDSPQKAQAVVYATPLDALAGCGTLKASNIYNVEVFSFGDIPGMDLWHIPVGKISRDYRSLGFNAGNLLLELRQLPRHKRLALRMETGKPVLCPATSKMKVPVCLITMVDADMLPSIKA